MLEQSILNAMVSTSPVPLSPEVKQAVIAILLTDLSRLHAHWLEASAADYLHIDVLYDSEGNPLQTAEGKPIKVWRHKNDMFVESVLLIHLIKKVDPDLGEDVLTRCKAQGRDMLKWLAQNPGTEPKIAMRRYEPLVNHYLDYE
jgi:hypothetical protein